MKVSSLIGNGFTEVALPDENREIESVYIGDLLSWVMGKAKSDCAWITIMSNINVLAVATLADVSCVILAEGVTLEKHIIDAALDKNINVLCCEAPIYETALRLSELLNE